VKEFFNNKFLPFIKKNWEFISIIFLLLLFSLLRTFLDNLFITAFGLIILLTFPGYFLSFLIFPKKDDLKIIERLGIVLITSIILSSVLGFVLVYLNNFNFLLAVWLFFGLNFLLAILGIIFRFFIDDSFKINIFQKGIIKKTYNKWLQESTLTKILSIFTILTVIGAFVSFIFILQYQPKIPGTTIFYLLDKKGNRISNIRTGENETLTLTMNINNSNLENINYLIEVWVANKTKTDILNYEFSNLNISLALSKEFQLNTHSILDYTFNLTFTNVGNWDSYFILWENEKPILNPLNQEQYLRDVVDSRIKPALQPDSETRIYGLNIPIFVLVENVEDTGDSFDTNSWTISSQGWNWSALATNSTFGGYRENGFVYMYSNITSSYLALRSSTRNDLIFNSSSHLYAESRIAPLTNVSNYHSFGISVDLSIGSPSWYRAYLASNTTHLFIGVNYLFTASGNKYSTPSVIPYNWTLGAFHTLRIDVDYNSKWISYQCDGIIFRNTTLDKRFIVDFYRTTIFVENKVNKTDSAMKMDYYKYGWTKEETPFESIKNYIEDLGSNYNTNWFTSSEGWNWLPTIGNETDFGLRINDYIEFLSPYNNSYQGISVPLNTLNFVKVVNQIEVSTNLTYIENSSAYNSFGLAVDLYKQDTIWFIAVIYSNSTHLKAGIASNYSIDCTFFTETIIPFNWARFSYHLLNIKIDYDNSSIAFYYDNNLIRNNLVDFGYIRNIYNATILVENNLNFDNATLRIDNFRAEWKNWNNQSQIYSYLADSIIHISYFNTNGILIEKLNNYYSFGLQFVFMKKKVIINIASKNLKLK